MRLERDAHIPKGWLDGDDSVSEPTLLYYGASLTRAGALLAAEWEKLDVADRAEIESEIHMRVARTVRERRSRGSHHQDPPAE